MIIITVGETVPCYGGTHTTFCNCWFGGLTYDRYPLREAYDTAMSFPMMGDDVAYDWRFVINLWRPRPYRRPVSYARFIVREVQRPRPRCRDPPKDQSRSPRRST